MVFLSTILEYLWYNIRMGRPKKSDTAIGVLAERQLPDGRRKINLRKHERADLQKQQMIEAAVALFLDISTGRTWAQVAEELGITTQKLKDLTKSEEFEVAYSQMFAEIGHDPRYKATQGWLLDMLPVAMRQLGDLLTSPQTPATARLNAIKMILELTNIDVKPSGDSDRKDMMKFLYENKAEIIVPKEYAEALQKYRPVPPPEEAPIEGEYLSISEDTAPVQS